MLAHEQAGSGAEAPDPGQMDLMTVEWSNSLANRLQQGQPVSKGELEAAVRAYQAFYDVSAFVMLSLKVLSEMDPKKVQGYIGEDVSRVLQRAGF